jgi:hypothetical protein
MFGELRRLAYVEGQNLVVERYSGEGQTANYTELASEVVRNSRRRSSQVQTLWSGAQGSHGHHPDRRDYGRPVGPTAL